MVIYAKPGTHSARYMRVRYKRKPPKVNDLILAKDNNAERHAKWLRFNVCEIKEVGGAMLYYLEHM
jgi:hypothetical protein